MGRLEGAVSSIFPTIPESLTKKIYIRFTYSLLEREGYLFYLAFNAIVLQMESEGIEFNKLPPTHIIITENGSVTLSEEDENVYGYQMNIIIYSVGNWRKHKISETFVLAIIIEELCHHFWNIDDEILVKHKVHEIMKRILKNVSFDEIYSKEFIEAYRKMLSQ